MMDHLPMWISYVTRGIAAVAIVSMVLVLAYEVRNSD